MKLVVLGDPVHHSLSPAIHRSAMAAAGITGTYDARPVDAHGMVAAVSELRARRLDGANVTMPHKQLAVALADQVDEVARRAGAANTLVGTDDGVVAFNTDVAGIRAAWDQSRLPPTGPVLILGAGGAAAAALLALEGRELTISARNPEAAVALLDACEVEAATSPWGTPVEGAVIVNATPIGMRQEALPGEIRAPQAGVFDMAYGSGTTPLVAGAKAAGRPYVDGEGMLIAQAAVSFELWTGLAPDQEAMRAGLEAERRRRGVE